MQFCFGFTMSFLFRIFGLEAKTELRRKVRVRLLEALAGKPRQSLASVGSGRVAERHPNSYPCPGPFLTPLVVH